MYQVDQQLTEDIKLLETIVEEVIKGIDHKISLSSRSLSVRNELFSMLRYSIMNVETDSFSYLLQLKIPRVVLVPIIYEVIEDVTTSQIDQKKNIDDATLLDILNTIVDEFTEPKKLNKYISQFQKQYRTSFFDRKTCQKFNRKLISKMRKAKIIY